MNDSEAREMARGLVRGSIIEDAASQFIAPVLKEAHDSRIKPVRDRIKELEAQIAAMEEGLTAVHMAGYMDGKKAAEAKLAKAMTGLNSIASNTCCDKCQEAALVARTTLAELKGQDDGQAHHAG